MVAQISGATVQTAAEVTAGYNNDSSVAWAWVTNLGNAMIRELRFTMNAATNYLDELTTDTLNIESQLNVPLDKLAAYNRMIGNVSELCTMQRSHPAFTLYIPLNLFFTQDLSVAFPSLAIQNQPIHMKTKIRALSELLCKSQSLVSPAYDFDSKLKIENLFFISKDVMTESGEAVSVSEVDSTINSHTHSADK